MHWRGIGVVRTDCRGLIGYSKWGQSRVSGTEELVGPEQSKWNHSRASRTEVEPVGPEKSQWD